MVPVGRPRLPEVVPAQVERSPAADLLDELDPDVLDPLADRLLLRVHSRVVEPQPPVAFDTA